MSLNDAVLALRNSVAISRLDHVHFLRVRGAAAYDALDRVCTPDLYVRDGQLLHGLLLDEDAHVFADIYIGCDDEEFFLLAEGPSAPALTDYLRRHTSERDPPEIEEMGANQKILGVDGPYAWELLGLILGQETIGLPYLTFFHTDTGICYRAGKTGEYGYGIIAAPDVIDGLWSRCLEVGSQFDVTEAGQDALDQCALENWFFNIRREGRETVTPIELQLQWRVSSRKDYVGSQALARRREEGPKQRLTAFVGGDPLKIGDTIRVKSTSVGRIVNAGFSTTYDKWIALGLLDIAWAYPGIDVFHVDRNERSIPLCSVSPPVINNRSLYLNPQIHSFSTRHEFEFPNLAGA